MKFRNIPIYTTRMSSPLGEILLAATDDGLAGAWFDAQRHWPDPSGWIDAPEHPVLREAARQLDDYFAGRRADFDMPLDLTHGTPFQQAVWQALLHIPPGATTSYGALSARIGKPAAVRAVGAAVGRNPISIVVPCHRVVGGDGSLTGYAGGLHRKTHLLHLEQGDLKVAQGQPGQASLPLGAAHESPIKRAHTASGGSAAHAVARSGAR